MENTPPCRAPGNAILAQTEALTGPVEPQHEHHLPSEPKQPAKFLASYTVGPKIASGGEGDIYRCHRMETGTIFVVKKNHPHKRTLAQEAKVLIELRTRNKNSRIIQPVAFYPKSRSLVLEYCNGGNLRTWKVNNGRLSEAFIRRCFKQLAEALAFLHTGWSTTIPLEQQWKPIVHCDIKPDNILLHGPGPDFRLADFGLAHEACPTGNTHIQGTYEFQPPEAPNCSPASDVWALGGIIHFLALGRAPVKHRPHKYTGPPEQETEWRRMNPKEVKAIVGPGGYSMSLNTWMMMTLTRQKDLRASAVTLRDRVMLLDEGSRTAPTFSYSQAAGQRPRTVAQG